MPFRALARWLSGVSVQHRIFTILQAGFALWLLYLWKHLPAAPGWAVAVLAVVAAAMSIHGEMRGWQKAIWMLLIGGLLVVELRTITKEKAESETKALADRAEQDARFADIRKAQDEDFKQTAEGLKEALRSVRQTLAQTRPRANLHFSNSISMLNPPETPGIFIGFPYTFRSDKTNDGNEDGYDRKALVKIYVGKPDDKAAQEELVAKFEKEWSEAPTRQPPFLAVIPQHPGFNTDQHIFTADEVARIKEGQTIYQMRRIEFSDSSGKWWSQDCKYLILRSQGQLNFHVAKGCLVFNADRIPATR
jgi:hypothetical protein